MSQILKSVCCCMFYRLDLNCSEQLRQKLHIYKDKNQIRRLKRHSLAEMSDSSLFLQKRETQGLSTLTKYF